MLHTRDLLGRAEGLYEAPGPDEHVSLLLEDAKGYEFPAEADAGGTRIFNARVTNLAPNLDELRAAGVATFVVEQAAMDEAERAAFAVRGPRGARAAGVARALHHRPPLPRRGLSRHGRRAARGRPAAAGPCAIIHGGRAARRGLLRREPPAGPSDLPYPRERTEPWPTAASSTTS